MSERAPEAGLSEGADPARSPSLDSDTDSSRPPAPDADGNLPPTASPDADHSPPTSSSETNGNRPPTAASDTDANRPPTASSDADPSPPTYKGAPLDAARGPGLGCFWTQVVLLVAMLILTPVSVWIAAPPWVSAALLLLSLGLLFFVGQTSIFLLRLVAADRRAQRRPMREDARPTVGQLSMPSGEDPSDKNDTGSR